VQPVQPVLSRRTVDATMAARGLRSAAELAQGKPCGTRLRYYAGCRCDACRAANTAYERQRAEARRRGESGRLISAERARAHLAWLSAQGVGRKQAADAAKVAGSIVSMIVDGQRHQIRAQTEARILLVTPAAAADGARIDAGPTWRLLDELLGWGYTRTRLASEVLGRPVRALQMSRKQVTVRQAERVRRVHARLRCVPAGPVLQQLAELSEEGYHRTRVQRALADAARRAGLPPPELPPRGGHVLHSTAQLVQALHSELMGLEVLAEGQS
jgi:hypothetical protein